LRKRASIFKILKASVPAALDLASQPVMWLVEAVFIGRLSAAALGGVGFALQLILLTITLLLTFVMGALILINRHLGSNDRWGANHILGQTLMSGFIFSILIGLTWYFGSPAIFRIIREQELMNGVSGGNYISGIDSGIQYLKIISLFAPIILTNFMAVSMIRGAGDTHLSMFINITMNLMNIVLTPIFIYGLFGVPRLEVRGAAIAVCISHTFGFCITVFCLRRPRSTLFLSVNELTRPNWQSIKQLFKLGIPTTVEQLVWSVGQVVVTGYVAWIGISALAVHQVFLRIQGVLSMFYMGFGLTAMTHMGKNIGANEHIAAENMGKMTHRIAFLFVLGILVLMIVFSVPLLHLFIRREDAILADFRFRNLFILFSLVQVPKAMNTVITGSLRGAGDIQWIMWVNLFAVLLLEVGANWVGTFLFNFGLFGIWSIQGLDEIVKSSINYYRFRCGKWKVIRIA
jgi:putative MATE family efflux protein